MISSGDWRLIQGMDSKVPAGHILHRSQVNDSFGPFL